MLLKPTPNSRRPSSRAAVQQFGVHAVKDVAQQRLAAAHPGDDLGLGGDAVFRVPGEIGFASRRSITRGRIRR